MQNLEKLWKDPKRFFVVDPNRKQAKPFPGKFPTKWWIAIDQVMNKGSKVIFDYRGKPNPLLIPKIERMMLEGSRRITFVEFDKGGAFAAGYRHSPMDNFAFVWIHASLNYFYYPWHCHGTLFDAWRGTMFYKNLKLDGRSFYIYAPYKAMDKEPETENLRGYRSWLRKTALLK